VQARLRLGQERDVRLPAEPEPGLHPVLLGLVWDVEQRGVVAVLLRAPFLVVVVLAAVTAAVPRL
jgi:hypothetical protein